MNLGLTGEDAIHAEIVQWARRNEKDHPELGLLHHIPNGGGRSPAQGMKLKALGVKPGVPDLCLPVARHGCYGLWLEIKDTKGRLSREQELWLAALEGANHRCEVIRSAEQGIVTIKEYLGI